MKSTPKSQESIKKFMTIFRNFFCKKFSMHGGLNQQKGGAIINKTQKTQESSRPKASQPKPTDLMDPDQANALGALD